MKKTIREYVLKDKKVIIRVDFNVPMKNGIITDDNRIIQSLETILYALNEEAKVILMSHLGRIKTKNDKKDNSLRPIAQRLSELLGKKVIFVPFTRGIELETAIHSLHNGEVLLMENTRFEDLIGNKESSNDLELGTYWASLGDIYINDAFGTAHRTHASNVGIASHLPNGVGFLIEKELKILLESLKNPDRPMTIILGGVKVTDKIGVIENLVKIADTILIGGGMAYTFLKAQGFSIGKSLLDRDRIHFCQNILDKYPDKIILPVDTVNGIDVTDTISSRTCSVKEIKENEIGLDIGPKTLELFEKYLNKSNTIIWNGPVGMFEVEAFSKGTKALCTIISRTKATTIIGGGDTASAAIQFGYQDNVSHISTGGGASLELLEGKNLPGIDVIENI